MKMMFVKHVVNMFMVCCTLKYLISFRDYGTIKELFVMLLISIVTTIVISIRDRKKF